MTSGTDSKLPDKMELGLLLWAGEHQPPNRKHQ
jgi:hypothetical protein